jgi:AcrR family transcriptional regulator
MKISQSAKEKTKIKILESAVELMTIKGYKNASLREIAKEAGVSNPTIYNYFPSKEKILYFYIEQKLIETNEMLQNIEDFHTYTLREQLQTLIETQLEFYLEDREFVTEIMGMALTPSMGTMELIYDSKEKFTEMVSEMLEIAIEAQEINEPPFKEYMPQLFWDYNVAVVAYWIKDDSEMFENTTQFIDNSMGVIEALLQSNILQKTSDLGMFMFKTHMLSSLQKFSTKQSGFAKIKRKLGEALNAK